MNDSRFEDEDEEEEDEDDDDEEDTNDSDDDSDSHQSDTHSDQGSSNEDEANGDEDDWEVAGDNTYAYNDSDEERLRKSTFKLFIDQIEYTPYLAINNQKLLKWKFSRGDGNKNPGARDR